MTQHTPWPGHQGPPVGRGPVSPLGSSRGGRSGWFVLVIALALILAALIGYGVYRNATQGPAAVTPSPSVTNPGSTDPGNSASPPSSSSSAPEPPGPEIPAHGDAGHWLDSRYVAGATEFGVTGENATPVGASADGSVFAVRVDDGVRGVAVPGGEEVWRHASYMCSRGSWNGIALCSDIAIPEDHFPNRIPGGLVGLDLATGTIVFEVPVQVLPSGIDFLGADDSVGYFIINDHAPGVAPFGFISVIAISPEGGVVWFSETGLDELHEQAAVIEGNRMALVHSFGRTINVIDLTTGDPAAEFSGEGLRLFWDGYSHYDVAADDGEIFYDWSGVEVARSGGPGNDFRLRPYPTNEVSYVTPVYDIAGLQPGEVVSNNVVFVSPEGENLLEPVSLDFQARNGAAIPAFYPQSIDPAGEVVAVGHDYKDSHLHSLADGSIIGEFTSTEYLDVLIVDGFLTATSSGEAEAVWVLLPDD